MNPLRPGPPVSGSDQNPVPQSVAKMFHVSPVLNRTSIETHGLDWTRMSAAPGIAGSRRPEEHGIFLAEGLETAHYFVRLNNTGGPVDISAVHDVNPDDLIDNGGGYSYVPYRIDRQRVSIQNRSLTEADLPPRHTLHRFSEPPNV